MINSDAMSLVILIAGYIIGLGAVTVIDILGFLGRKSGYWTRATIQTHKVTKPLIWVGIIFATYGSVLFYIEHGFPKEAVYHLTTFFILILNGLFLSMWVSPRLLEREANGLETEVLPKSWQRAITLSFVISFLGWWGSLFLFVTFLVSIL